MGVLTQGNTQMLAQSYFNNKRVPGEHVQLCPASV